MYALAILSACRVFPFGGVQSKLSHNHFVEASLAHRKHDQFCGHGP